MPVLLLSDLASRPVVAIPGYIGHLTLNFLGKSMRTIPSHLSATFVRWSFLTALLHCFPQALDLVNITISI